MNVKYTMAYIPMTNIASSTLTGSYQPINSSGTTEPCWAFKIVNNSTEDVTVSLDGIHDHDYVPSNSGAVIDVYTNSQTQNKCNVLGKNTVVYVKGTAGTGNVYLVGFMNPSANWRGL
jgi:hypothetical protein